jgi:hypothetical protein
MREDLQGSGRWRPVATGIGHPDRSDGTQMPLDCLGPILAKPISGQRHMPAASTGRTHDRKQCSRQKSPRQPLQTQGRPHMLRLRLAMTVVDGRLSSQFTPAAGRPFWMKGCSLSRHCEPGVSRVKQSTNKRRQTLVVRHKACPRESGGLTLCSLVDCFRLLRSLRNDGREAVDFLPSRKRNDST